MTVRRAYSPPFHFTITNHPSRIPSSITHHLNVCRLEALREQYISIDVSVWWVILEYGHQAVNGADASPRYGGDDASVHQ